jgi:hypothetical protein
MDLPFVACARRGVNGLLCADLSTEMATIGGSAAQRRQQIPAAI